MVIAMVWSSGLGGAGGAPLVQFRFEGVDGGLFFVEVAMDGEAFDFFPSLDGAYVAIEIGSDFFPGVEPVIPVNRRRSCHARAW